MKILREDEKDVLQFANEHPLASIGRLFTTARSRIAEDALSLESGVFWPFQWPPNPVLTGSARVV
jgi:hypothetical protein